MQKRWQFMWNPVRHLYTFCILSKNSNNPDGCNFAYLYQVHGWQGHTNMNSLGYASYQFIDSDSWLHVDDTQSNMASPWLQTFWQTPWHSIYLDKVFYKYILLKDTYIEHMAIVLTTYILSNLCRATSRGYINFGCSRKVLFLGCYFQWSMCHAGEIVLLVERGSRSLGVPL